MFQKLWPFANNSQPNGSVQAHEHSDHGTSTKVKPIHASFNKGIPLNMKIVIRGDIRTGKTSLFERLQGLPFRKELSYKTTDQIQVANVPWQYPHTKDIIKVEIWDVVDKGVQAGDLKSSHSNGNLALKIDNNAPTSPIKTRTRVSESNPAPHAAFSLDASTIDVYRNTDGVFLLYDLSKPWTIDYASKALSEIPVNIPVLILSNFSDDSHSKSVMESERIEVLIHEHNKERRNHPCAPANLIRHLDTNMKTGLGLQEIHQSFGLPFLNVLRETHRKQFELKTQEINELLRTLSSQSHNRSKRQTRPPQLQISTGQSQMTLNKSAQNTGTSTKLLVPQTSTPTSPARKTRNEYTNVDILSPTPVTAQPPAVLLDFNSGKLEESFFQNASMNFSTSTDALEYAQGGQLESEVGGNPMVTGDEDIDEEDIKLDNITEKSNGELYTAEETVWSASEEGKNSQSHHVAKEFSRNGEIKIQGEDSVFNSDKNNDGLESIDDGQYKFQGVGSNIEEMDGNNDSSYIKRSYHDDESPRFVHEDQVLVNTMSQPIHSHYEIVGVQSENPWTSAEDSLNNISADNMVNYQSYESHKMEFNATGSIEPSSSLSEPGHESDNAATEFNGIDSTEAVRTVVDDGSIISPITVKVDRAEDNNEKEKKPKKSKKKNKKSK